ncbi:MAG TPA: adenylate kinase [Nitrososphaerales archaeon]|nr:adenylate kinase [Nitrososphaerales archaeon]
MPGACGSNRSWVETRLRVVVVGIPGVGKTTVVQKASGGIRGSKIVTFGTVMLEEATRLGWIRSRDQLRTLPVEKQKRLQTLAAARISRMKEKTVFVDTHLFIRTGEGYWPGLPFDVVRALDPTHLLLVEADPEEIAERRASDKTRSRDALTKADLAAELALGRSFLAASATLTGAPMLIVVNNEGKSDEAAAAVVKVLKEAAK